MKDIDSTGAAKRLLPLLFGVALLLGGCGERSTPEQPLELTADAACSLDGMILKDFPGPKAQIQSEHGQPDHFCDTKERFPIFLRPEQKKRIVAIYTQDMGQADWTHPESHWIDARKAFYVVGSKRRGSMGPTLAAFAREDDARKFSEQYGGDVRRFEQVTIDMVDLSGGTSHDERM